MEKMRVRVGSNGRLVIPSEFRKAMGISEGDELLVRFVEGEMHISTMDTAIRHAQALVRQYVPREARLVDELIQERRDAASSEL
jgi:AbrB family looped-hinge helix DNA binding protein